MFNGHDWMGGMHWGWWILWVVIIVGIVLLFVRGTSQRRGSPPQESPRDILERRYAAGEISTEDYEERKERLN